VITLEHRYEPRGACRDAHYSKARELLLSGPAGTGKSRALLEKIHRMCLDPRNGGMRALALRKTAVSFTSTGLVTYREHVAPEALARRDVVYYGGSAMAPAQFRYSNGSTITLGGLDKATKIMSSEYDVIYVQEAIECTEDDWEAITTRLRNGRVSFQQLMADTNPSTPTHWLYQRVLAGRTQMIDTRHEDNPILFDELGQLTERGAAYMEALDNLTGVRYERLRHGRWVAAEGLIYEDFDPNTHVQAPPGGRIPDEWPRYWSIDFGYTNPFVCQWWAEDPDGRLWLYREVYRTKTLVEDHAKVILKQVTNRDGAWTEPKPRAIICDHDAEDRATLERHIGMGTVAAQKTVSDGIQAVQARFRIAKDGKPRIYLCPDAVVQVDRELESASKPTSTIAEVPGYVWDRAKEGTAAAEKPPKEEPLKRDDHGCDAKRYACAYLDLQPRPRMRWVR